MAALQSPAGRALLARCGRSPDDISSIVLVEKSGCYLKSEAVRRIGARLGVPFPLLAALAEPFPLPIRDFLYDQVGWSAVCVRARACGVHLAVVLERVCPSCNACERVFDRV
jgi:hypothetical protein